MKTTKPPVIEQLHCDIRGKLYEEALRMMQKGIPVLKLNTGNPGAFGFGMPEHLKNLIARNLETAVPYCDFHGMAPAIEAIVGYHREKEISDFDKQDIFITNGVSEGALLLMEAMLCEGDEVLLPMPC